MAQITRFAEKLLEHNETEPESIRLFRKLAEGEDIRILLGDFFCALRPMSRKTGKTRIRIFCAE